jgi:ATP-dependent Clp protease ATP-binding subunit ClpC
MFERFTDKARRAIYFARYEAGIFASPYIETDHLLLGLLRASETLADRMNISLPAIRKDIAIRTTARETVDTPADLGLSNECKRVLGYAVDEADLLLDKYVGTEHLFLGLLREERCVAAMILHDRGIGLMKARVALTVDRGRPAPQRLAIATKKKRWIPYNFSIDLTQAARDKKLHPCIGREKELEQVIQIMLNKSNPVLVGEPGIGKRAVVEGLVQHIVANTVPATLTGKSVLMLDLLLVPDGKTERTKLDVLLNAIASEAEKGSIFFIDQLHLLNDAAEAERLFPIMEFLRSAILDARTYCIITTTRGEYDVTVANLPWLQQCFRVVRVSPPTQEEAVNILLGIKVQYETFHAVCYTEEALKYAVYHSNSYLPDRNLPEKAIDLIDEAGVYAKLRQLAIPADVMEAQKRLNFINHRMGNAIKSHEFEKARDFAQEADGESKILALLRKKYEADERAMAEVTWQDMETVVARWAGLPVPSFDKHIPPPIPIL